MNRRQKSILLLSVCVIIALFFATIFSESGFKDYYRLKEKRLSLKRKNREIIEENERIDRLISRLKNDMDYIEYIARTQLGMVRKDEIILNFNTTYQGEPYE